MLPNKKQNRKDNKTDNPPKHSFSPTCFVMVTDLELLSSCFVFKVYFV